MLEKILDEQPAFLNCCLDLVEDGVNWVEEISRACRRNKIAPWISIRMNDGIVASRCGKYFVADCYDTPETPLLVGNIDTGKTAVLCHARAEGGGAQHTHAHPYFTSNNQWVVFNSDRTGITQIYLARVPDGFLQSLD